MKHLEMSIHQIDVVNRGLNKTDNKPISKHFRTNLEKITVGVAIAATIATITYGGYCLYQNNEEAIKNQILASELGYPEAIPCPAPSDPRVKPDIKVEEVAIARPISNNKATPCPTPIETSKLG